MSSTTGNETSEEKKEIHQNVAMAVCQPRGSWVIPPSPPVVGSRTPQMFMSTLQHLKGGGAAWLAGDNTWRLCVCVSLSETENVQ